MGRHAANTVGPASVPPVARVDVVSLNGRWPDANAEDYLPRSALTVTVDGAEAERLTALWHALPPGKQMRCHNPPYGLRFCDVDGVIVAEASLCWECNNIHGRAGIYDLFFEFDASAVASQQLLTEARRLATAADRR